MPMPNNHACELRDSSEFDPDSIRSRKQVHDGKEYTVRFGREKDSGKSGDISYLYPKDTWEEGSARGHCEDHDGTFVAADGGESESASIPLDIGAQVPQAMLTRIAATPWAMLQSELQRVFVSAADEGREPPTLTTTFWNCDSDTARRDCEAVTGESRGPQIAWHPEAAKLDVPRSSSTVAVVPVYGVIDSKRIYYADVFADELGALLAALVGNPEIGAIVLDIDSPGGSVYGIEELADQIRGYRSVKSIYSIATGMEASAAYWIGSAATKAFASPSSEVGSIGVWTAHVDASKMLDDFGLKVTLISAGKYKVEGNPFGPLPDEARAAIQDEVNGYYGKFAEGVARNRNRRPSTVRNGFGEGRVLLAEKALEEGMIDGIATMPELLGAIVPRRRGSRTASAMAAVEIERANG